MIKKAVTGSIKESIDSKTEKPNLNLVWDNETRPHKDDLFVDVSPSDISVDVDDDEDDAIAERV